jgi:hypothetical protein
MIVGMTYSGLGLQSIDKGAYWGEKSGSEGRIGLNGEISRSSLISKIMSYKSFQQ